VTQHGARPTGGRHCWTMPAALADHVRPPSPMADAINLAIGRASATLPNRRSHGRHCNRCAGSNDSLVFAGSPKSAKGLADRTEWSLQSAFVS
jgi:hypothetical protein